MKDRKEKEKRCANFNEFEKDALIEVAYQYKHIIENKETNATTWKKKQETWEIITNEYNVVVGTYRSSKTIRSKYETMKKELKKKCAKIKAEEGNTGGGLPHMETILKEYEEKLLSIMQLSMLGLSSCYENDTTLDADPLIDEIKVEAEFLPNDKAIWDSTSVQNEDSGITVHTDTLNFAETSSSCNGGNCDSVQVQESPATNIPVTRKARKWIGNVQPQNGEVITWKKKVLQLQYEMLLEERAAKAEINALTIENLKADLEIKKLKLMKET